MLSFEPSSSIGACTEHIQRRNLTQHRSQTRKHKIYVTLSPQLDIYKYIHTYIHTYMHTYIHTHFRDPLKSCLWGLAAGVYSCSCLARRRSASKPLERRARCKGTQGITRVEVFRVLYLGA